MDRDSRRFQPGSSRGMRGALGLRSDAQRRRYEQNDIEPVVLLAAAFPFQGALAGALTGTRYFMSTRARMGGAA